MNLRLSRMLHTLSKTVLWDLAIWIAGLIYLGMVLFLNLYSPLFGLTLIVLAVYQVLEPRHTNRRP